jgi:regulatory protein
MEAFEGDWTGNARDLIARRHAGAQTGDRAAQRKAVDFLLRRGFSMEQARAALRPSLDAGGQGRCL